MLRTVLLPVTTRFQRENKGLTDIIRYLHGSSYSDVQQSDINVTETKVKLKPIKTSNKKRSKLNNNENLNIINHLNNINPDIVTKCPNQFLKLHPKETNVLNLVDKEIAKKFVSLIKNDLLKNMCFVAELNPGFGILTTELLKAGLPLIHLYEGNKKFHPILNEISNNYPGKLDVRKFNLLKISQLLFIDRSTDEKKVEDTLQDVQYKEWEDEPCMQVIGATSTPSFFRHLIFSLLFRNCLMSFGRPIFYIAIPPSLWHSFTCDNKNHNMYTTKKVMFQVLFNYKLLGILDRKAFLPLPRRNNKLRNSSISEYKNQDYEEIYVIKLEPKADIYSQLPRHDWILFWYFMRQSLHKRSNRVIPELEKWVPGCGIRLIAKNFTIFTQFGELSPEECLSLFKEFKSWPEYKISNFLTSLHNSLNTYNEPTLMELDNYETQE